MEKTNPSCIYFNKILNFLPIHPLITSICIIIENLSILSNTFISINKIINLSSSIKKEYLFYTSIYNITKYASIHNATVHAIHFAFGIVLTCIYVIYKLCLIYNYSIAINIHKTLTTLFEYFWFRLYSIFFYDALIYFICFSIQQGQLKTLQNFLEYFWICLLLFMLCGYIIWFIKHFCIYGIVSNMNYFKYEHFNYFPFDNVYSVIYDTVILFEKIILVLIINLNNFFILNNTSTTNNQKQFIFYVIYFLHWITLILPFINSLYVGYIVFINKHLFLTIQYSAPNKTRLYISIVFSIAIIMKACLYKTPFLFYTLFFISIILSLIIYIYSFHNYIHKKAIHSTSLIGVLIYSFNNKINIDNFIYEWLIHHKFACKNHHCTICANTKTNSCLTYVNYYTVLYNEIHYRNQFGLEKYINYSEYYLDLMEIVNYVINENIQKVSFYYMYFGVLEKYKYVNVCLYCNFLLLFESITQNKNEFEKMCKDFIQSEGIIKSLNVFLNDYEEFLFYTVKNPFTVYKIALKFNTLVNTNEISNFLSHSYNDYNYQLIILRYVYERISQVPLKGNNEIFDVSIYSEFIDYHYNNDKMLLLKYSLLSNSVVVFKAGGELKCFINKPFDTLFERNVRNQAVKKFIQLINTNDFNDEKNIFEFFIHKDEEYIHSFVFKYVIYPSIETDEMIISGDYSLNKYDMIIFANLNKYIYEKTHNNNNNNNNINTNTNTTSSSSNTNSKKYEYLYSFSNSFEKIFIIPPSMYQHLSLNGKYLLFNDIFTKTFSNTNDTNNNNNNMNINNNHNKHYYKLNTTNIISILNEYLTNNTIATNNSIELTHNKSLLFQITKQYSIETDNTTYIIYYITTSNTKTTNISQLNKTPIHRTASTSDILSQNLKTKSLFQFNDNISVSCTSTLISTKTSSSFGNEKLFFKKSSHHKHSDLTTIYKFVILIAICCLLTVLICIIFLILEVIEIKHFKNLFLMYQKYLFLKISFELQPIRLFVNLCLATQMNANNCIQPYKNYSLNLLSDTNIPLDLINDIVLYEMSALIKSIDNSFKTIQNDLYKMKSKHLINIIESYEVNLLFLDEISSLNNNTNDKVNITLKRTPLIQSVDIFSNFFTVVINNEKTSPFSKTPIRFIWLNLTSFSLNSDILQAHLLNEMNRNIYHIFINYPSVHNALFLFQEEIEHSFELELNSIKTVLIVFCWILFALNVILLILCEKFISMYTNILYRNYIQILNTINNEHYKLYASSLVKNLKLLLQLYEERPSHLIHVITNDKDKYTQNILHQHQLQLQLQLNTNITDDNNNNNNNTFVFTKDKFNKREYSSITHRFSLAIIYSFTLYLIIFIAIVIVMIFMLMFLSDLVTYTEINSQLDNYLYSNINLFQLSLIANITSFESVTRFDDNNNNINDNNKDTKVNDFILAGIGQHYISMKSYELFIEAKKQYQHIHNSINVSCSVLYSLNNSNVAIVEKAYGIDLKYFTEVVCYKMSIMKYQSIILVLKEICYVLERLSTVNVIVEYNDKKEVLRESDLYKIYTLVLFINKIIRGYFNEIAIPNKVDNVIKLVELAVKICLVLNAMLEVAIEGVLIFFVMQKMIKVNKVIMKFLKFLE